MNIFIAGLGLIGGSFAKAFKRYTDHAVYGFDINPTTAQFALSRGAIDFVADESDLINCDFVVVCLYPKATVECPVQKRLCYNRYLRCKRHNIQRH